VSENFEGKIDTASIRWVNDCEYDKKLHQRKTWLRKINRHENINYTSRYLYL
jgi:hypothetical protein